MSSAAVINFAGEIQGRARFDIPDMSRTNLVLEPRTLELRNAREGRAPSLEREGFTLLKHESRVCRSEDMAEIDRVYHQEVAAAIKQLLGADMVAPQRSGLLVRRGERSKRPTWGKPARFAHLDYTPVSTTDFLGWMHGWEGVDPHDYSRTVIVQTWRAISPPPQDNTLALCDARTVTPGDCVVFDAVIDDSGKAGGIFESRLLKPSTTQGWYFWPDLHADELLVFMAHDSAGKLPSDVPHTAIDNPLAGPNAEPRESLEARFFVYFK